MKKQPLFLTCLSLSLFCHEVVFSAENSAENEKNSISHQVMVEIGGCPGCDLHGYNFNRHDLSGWDFRYAKLDGATFCLANLNGAIFNKASLINVRFDGADLSSAQFIEARMDGVSMAGAYTKNVIYEGPPPDEGYEKGEKAKELIIALPEVSDPDPGVMGKSVKAVPKTVQMIEPVHLNHP